jgi:ATP-dependent helicase/nuclease subunit A
MWHRLQGAEFFRASQPSLTVRTVTALARSEAFQQLGTFPPVRVELIKRGDFGRPSGRRFGARVHAMLASVDLDSDADAIQSSAAVNGRLVGATEEEILAAVATVRATLEHPTLRRAAASARKREIRRETPVLLTLDEGGLVEGVVDLAFLEGPPEIAGWTVVDFKTDREFATSSDRYTAQVSVYSAAIQAATGLPSRGILLII